MKMVQQWADEIAARLEDELQHFPASFFGTFEYTTTGNNLCHPLTIGVLTKLLWQFPEVTAVGVDVRFNRGKGIKM